MSHISKKSVGKVSVFRPRTPVYLFINKEFKIWFPYQRDAVHIQCPLDYFEPTLKSQLFSSVGSYEIPSGSGFIPRSGTPAFSLCGEHMQDQVTISGEGYPTAGAKGNWFWMAGYPSFGEENEHLSLGDHVYKPDMQQVFYVGMNNETEQTNLTSGGAQAYYFDRGNISQNPDVNIPFEQVDNFATYCYENLKDIFGNPVATGKVMYLRLEPYQISGQWHQKVTIKLESSYSTCPDQL